MTVFAAALGTLFRDPNLSVPGRFTPPGRLAVAVRVLRTTATDRAAGSTAQFGIQAEQDEAELLMAQVPDRPEKGAVLEYDGKRLRVAQPAASARHGLTWRVVLASA